MWGVIIAVVADINEVIAVCCACCVPVEKEVKRIAAATDLPVTADLEGGYDAPAVSYYKALAEKEGANFTDLGFYSELVDELGLDHPSVQEEYRLLSYEFNTRLALA